MNWKSIGKIIQKTISANTRQEFLDQTQRISLTNVCASLDLHGKVIADEVGTGKTRIASVVALAVSQEKGRVVIVVPRGLIHQWKNELKIVAGANELDVIPLENYLSIFDHPELIAGPKKPQIIILSHTFRFPIVRETSPAHRFHLAPLVAGALANLDKRHFSGGRPSCGAYFNQVRGQSNQIKFAEFLAEKVRNLTDANFKKYLIDGLVGIPFIQRDGRIQPLPKDFVGDALGRELSEKLIGMIIGKVDLLIVDEAHKSRVLVTSEAEARSEERGYKKVLERILTEILMHQKDERILTLTATPVEMGSHQWQSILCRTGIDKFKDADALKPVQGFAEALRRASRGPDESQVLEDLLKSAGIFEKALKPYVIRRRTSDLAHMRIFLRAANPEHKVHPHRNTKPVLIPFSGLTEKWKRIITACEGLAQASKGLPFSGRQKQVYIRIASGDLSSDLLFDELYEDMNLPKGEEFVPPSMDDETPQEKAQKARVEFWLSQLRAEMRSSSEAELELYDHPRLRATADEIDKWVVQKEKVLVFGVSLQPLRRLRNLVNARHILRCLDRGQPVSKSTLPRQQNIRNLGYKLLSLELRNAQASGHIFNGKLKVLSAANPNCESVLKKIFEKSNNEYETQRNRLRSITEKSISAIAPELVQALRPGSLDSLLSYVRASVVERAIFLEGSTYSQGREELLKEVIEDLMSILKSSDHGADSAGEDQLDPEELEQIRHRDREQLLEIINEGQQLGTFCKLMDGSTQWPTRRHIQAGFMRETGFPTVLLAQSQVGREGLNLHTSCRVVIQFHPEWNPGVLEQQIGRVDRHNSKWSKLAIEWIASDRSTPAPAIEVRQIVFAGTYDEHQWRTLYERRNEFDASLFSALMPAEALAAVPLFYRERLRKEAPNFSPYDLADLGD